MTYLVRTYKQRLYLTDEQEATFRRFSGVCRLVYNLALEQRRDWWRQFRSTMGRGITLYSQDAEIKELRRDFEFVRNCPYEALSDALRDVDRAFRKFYRGEARHPKPRKKGDHDSFVLRGDRCGVPHRVSRRWGEVRLTKIGRVRFRWTRDIPENIRTVTCVRDALGWHICFSVRIPHEAPKNDLPAVGIDRGVARTIQLSDGNHASMPKGRLSRLEKTRKVHQRAMSRRRRGSARYAKARALRAKTDAKIARLRLHWNHERTRHITDTYGAVVLEDLRTANMTRSAKGTVKRPGKNVAAKRGLNRSILAQSWSQFERLLSYKLEVSGGRLIKVPPQNTSRTCAECGSVSKDHRKSQAVFQCGDCGHEAHADENAAINILRAGVRPAWTEGAASRQPLREAQTAVIDTDTPKLRDAAAATF